ncbi:MAG: hypothetical protein NT031_12785 [Planctomycetota bacterium]|nr:hypothetical protein [Planctomycetota bacterium]
MILAPDDYNLWLDPGVHEAQELLPLLRPYSAEKMVAYPVSTVANGPVHESSECAEPAGAAEAPPGG